MIAPPVQPTRVQESPPAPVTNVIIVRPGPQVAHIRPVQTEPLVLAIPPTHVHVIERTKVIQLVSAQPKNSETIRKPDGRKPNGETIPPTIPETILNNSPKNSEEELLAPAQVPPRLDIAPYKKKGKVGRQRRYEEPGKHGEIPVHDVVLFRHVMGRHWPGMSKDMTDWYEWYYFTRPKRTEKAKDAKEYERHCNSYERGERWIREHSADQPTTSHAATPAMGDSSKIVAYRKRATS